jgi:hypothetical protein
MTGSLGTIHASGPREAMTRLEMVIISPSEPTISVMLTTRAPSVAHQGDGPRGETPGRFVCAGLRPRFPPKAEQHELGPPLLRAISHPDDGALLQVG